MLMIQVLIQKEDIKRRNVNTKKSIQSQKHRIDFDNEVVIKHSLTKKKSKSKKKRKKTPIKVSIEDAALAEKRVSVLMGDAVEPRKLWIEENVEFSLEDNYQI